MYVFEIRVAWTPAVVGADEVAGAQAIVFVDVPKQADAEKVAVGSLMHHGWKVEAIEEAHQLSDAQLVYCEPELRPALENARTHRVGTFLSAWPKEERPETTPPEFRQLPKSKAPKTRQ